jgi:hypothetical protein
MPESYRPVAGQVVMVEPADSSVDVACFTGVVLPPTNDHVTIDVGMAVSKLVDGAEVLVSVFSADALYRLRGGTRAKSTTVLLIDPLLDVERVQRRRSARPAIRVSVTLVSTDESDPDVSRVAGRSLDIGAGGLRVETIRPLPAAAEPIAIVSVPQGAPLMLPTRVIAAQVDEEGCEYRLAFTQLRPTDAERLAVLMSGTHATADTG